MHNAYSASHVRETHDALQCADRRNVNNRDNSLYTHKTCTIQAQKRTVKFQGVTLGLQTATLEGYSMTSVLSMYIN